MHMYTCIKCHIKMELRTNRLRSHVDRYYHAPACALHCLVKRMAVRLSKRSIFCSCRRALAKLCAALAFSNASVSRRMSLLSSLRRVSSSVAPPPPLPHCLEPRHPGMPSRCQQTRTLLWGFLVMRQGGISLVLQASRWRPADCHHPGLNYSSSWNRCPWQTSLAHRGRVAWCSPFFQQHPGVPCRRHTPSDRIP